MATPILMPTFGMTEGEATVLRWMKEPGQIVAADEPLFEAETEKATLEVPAPAAGVLLRIDAQTGQSAPYKAVVGWIGGEGEVIDINDNHSPTSTGRAAPPDAALLPEPAAWVKASPIARRIARERGIDLSMLTGSGPSGRIVEADVHRALATRAAAPAPEDEPSVSADPAPAGTVAMTAARRLTAARMAESFRTAPHFYLQREVRAARLVDLRSELVPVVERQTGVRLSFTDFFLRSLALALPDHPFLNASWTGDGITIHTVVDLGVAVAAPQGLVVPVIRQAGTLSLVAIAQARSDVAQRAREGKLRPEEMQGGTFTLTNLGMYGVDSFMPILNPPQSAILAAGAIAERPIADRGALVLQPTLHLTLAVDHRVADGAHAALFLADLVSLLESPSRLLL